MNIAQKILTMLVLIGGISAVGGVSTLLVGGLINETEVVNMAKDGCWTTISGSRTSVYQYNKCRFIDPRDGSYYEQTYHPLAYQTMDAYPVGTKFAIKDDTISTKNRVEVSSAAFILGILGAFVSLIGLVIVEGCKSDQR